MTDKEYNELEERIEQRKRIRAMADDLAASKKDRRESTRAAAIRYRLRGEKPFADAGESSPRAKSAGGSFEKLQIQNEG